MNRFVPVSNRVALIGNIWFLVTFLFTAENGLNSTNVDYKTNYMPVPPTKTKTNGFNDGEGVGG